MNRIITTKHTKYTKVDDRQHSLFVWFVYFVVNPMRMK